MNTNTTQGAVEGAAAAAEPGTMPAYSAEITPERLRITDAAQHKIAELLSETDDEIAGIRVFIAGGGCSGMQYGMTFAEVSHPTDNMFEGRGFRFFVDPVAISFLEGAEIDYVDDGIGATFVFNNVFQAVGGSGACAGCGGAS